MQTKINRIILKICLFMHNSKRHSLLKFHSFKVHCSKNRKMCLMMSVLFKHFLRENEYGYEYIVVCY